MSIVQLTVSCQDRDGTGRDGTGRDGTGRDGTGRDGTGRDGTGRDGTGRDGTGRDGTGRDGTGRDGTGRDGTTDVVSFNQLSLGRVTSPRRQRQGSVVVSTSAWHAGWPGPMPSHGRYGIFGVTTWLSTLGAVYPS